MPNKFTPRAVTQVPQNVINGNSITTLLKEPPGFFRGMGLRLRQSKAQANVQRAAIDAIEQEGLATVAVVAQGQGELMRAEHGRLHAQVVAAICAELSANSAAASTELATARFGGSIANIRNRAEMIRTVQRLIEAGDVGQEDSDALVATAVDLHQEAESRIDDVYQDAAAMVLRAFSNATAQARTINSKGQ